MMGKLRIEPKVKPLLNEEEYSYYKGALEEALAVSSENHVFWDLDAGEKSGEVRKYFQYVAKKEGIGLRIRARRGTNTLTLSFEGVSRAGTRISAKECKDRIESALKASGQPMQKSEIIAATGISPSSWNVRIKELLSAGVVEKSGTGRRTSYLLP